jgi:N-glycosylase/DNA lyase
MKQLVFSRKDGLNAYLCDGVFVAEGGNLVFSAEKTFDCGQCFRWEKLPDGSFVGVVKGRLLSLRENSSGFTVSDLCGALDTGFAEFLVSYFDLMTDYGSVTRELSGLDSVIEKAAEAGQGIRLLRQELFETVISFIISANNNIPRIKKCVARLSEMCGGKIAAFGGKDYFAFPEPGAITGFTDEEIQVTAGVGYRAPFIRQTAELFADGFYSFLKLLDAKCYGTLKKTVLALPGVGEKVAGCVTLFTGIDRSAFPVDVWVERMCEELYGLKGFTRPALQKRMEEYFGENGGLAQQYLFNYIRSIS